ncbi:GH25 family lysozyme [uncultured Clostridium sp.]|uniref:GH25 family lysozyme n=1 Tax=uncultured Clostridium sp. TaxID=59620 RepID=UPI00260F8B28|nr:GH25 family lysozyme [uncultured Clostridium sp.]
MMNIKGIDISMFQPNINLEEVSNQGYKVCYIKATEGQTYTDPLFMQNYNKAKEAGLDIGFYHFIHSYDNGAVQARFLLEKIKGLDYNCRIAIDIEVTDNQSAATINKCINDFVTEITNQTGHYPCIYTNLSFANEYLDSSLSKYGLWLAEYGVNEPEKTKVWGNTDNLIGWQHADNGNFTGSTDLDVFNTGIYIPEMKRNLAPGDYATVTTPTLHVRSGAGLNYPIIGTVHQGDKIQLSNKVGEWWSTCWGEHGGFMYAEYLK